MDTQIIQLTNDPQVTLTTYILDSSPELCNANTRPGILIFPGGAYINCSDREAEPIAMAYLAEGYNAFVLRYSLGEKANFPQPLTDAETALTCIRNNAEKWHVGPDKIAVCGFSAGGHLAAALGTMGTVRPNAMILGYPCILGSMGDKLNVSIPSCEKYVDKDTPPAFIFSTSNDEIVPVKNSIAFAAALEAAGIPFEIHIFQNGCHGLSLAKGVTSSGLKRNVNPDVAQWLGLSLNWLENIFGSFKSDKDYYYDGDISRYNTNIPLGILWENSECKKLILKYFPVLAESKDLRAAMGASLSTMNKYAGDIFTEDKLVKLDAELKKIPLKK